MRDLLERPVNRAGSFDELIEPAQIPSLNDLGLNGQASEESQVLSFCRELPSTALEQIDPFPVVEALSAACWEEAASS